MGSVAGDQTVAFSVTVGAATSGAGEELERSIVSRGAMLGFVTGRERRSRWAIVSLVFALGFAASTSLVRSERNAALDSLTRQARDEAQLVTATLTGRQLIEPVTGSSYGRLATKIRRSLSSRGAIVGLTVWTSDGRILFSLNGSLVGTSPPEMQPLIVWVSQTSGGTRVLDDTVQTFMPVSKATGGPVAVVEVDQPLALVQARTSDFWNMLRLGSAVGLVVSLLLFGLTFVSSRNLPHAPVDEEPPAEERAPASEESIQALQPDLDQTVDHVDVLEADLEILELMRQRREEFKARAKEAELRVKQLEAQLQEAPSAPKSEQ
jgi:hypothetical protein